MVYKINIPRAIKKMKIKQFREFIYENYYRPIEKQLFFNETSKKEKDLLLLATKLIKNYLILVIPENTFSFV